ncbi:MAG: helix-turn-helix domain-containing protein [Acidocella sp.]|uniref:helix-turn-helix domain-containing protein n=1 Tax=Acidocella sp. TaxID=50710 RepID=UPI003FC59CE6
MSLKVENVTQALFFTAEQVAEITGLSIATIRRAIRDQKLRAHKFGRAVRIHHQDLNIYIGRSRGENA